MGILTRVLAILLRPHEAWQVATREEITFSQLLASHLGILAWLPALGGFISCVVMGRGRGFVSVVWGLVDAVVIYLSLNGVTLLVAHLTCAMAPFFSSRPDRTACIKLLGYGATAPFVAGLMLFVPMVGPGLFLLGFAYGAYIIYLGLPLLVGTPQPRLLAFASVISTLWIISSTVITSSLRLLSRLLILNP